MEFISIIGLAAFLAVILLIVKSKNKNADSAADVFLSREALRSLPNESQKSRRDPSAPIGFNDLPASVIMDHSDLMADRQSTTRTTTTLHEWQADITGDVVPDGKYVVRFAYEKPVGETLWVGFQITVGPHQGRPLVMVLDSRKVKRAIQERNGGWIDWLQFEEDKKGTEVYQAINQSFAGQFMVLVKEGWVKKVYDPGENWEQIVRQFSTEWVVTPGEDGWKATFDVCKKFYAQMDSLPNIEGESAKERALARWLTAALKEGKPTFRPEVKVWVNSIRSKLCDEFNARNPSGGSMKNWLGNHGFSEE